MALTLHADFAAPQGRIRPLHGVNAGPMTKVFTYDARPGFRAIGIPYARLHDIEYPYGSGEFVDIPCIFRSFDADETDPQNYNFGLTDEYLRRCFEVGAEPLFRLGVSIEHAPVKRHIYPPKDYAKWARICEYIIRHYTEGWADGHHWPITYWEIWNEPDGGDNMWLGTPAQYYALYAETARHLKACFPHLKIGGAGFTRGINDFTRGFLQFLAAEHARTGARVPLDFFSWHRYFTDPDRMTEESAAVDALLAAHGYADAESVFDEWNYMLSWAKDDQAESYRRMKSHIGAAYCAAVLCAMQQQTDIALACYFEADVVKEFCGIFTTTAMAIGRDKHATVELIKGGYAFRAFGDLYRMGSAVPVEGCADHIYACAATGEAQGLLAVNYTDAANTVTLDLRGLAPGALTARITDATRTDAPILTLAVPADGTLTLTLPMTPNSFLWLSR